MKNMPVEYFGYYTLLEPYISAYYETEAKEKGRKLFKDVSAKYQENLTYYSNLKIENQYRMAEDIVTDIERYKSLVDVLLIYDKDFAKDETKTFSRYLNLFNHFYEDPEPTEETINSDPDIGENDTVIKPE